MIARSVSAPIEAAAEPRTFRFTYEDYERMHEIGIFDEDSRVELIQGEVVSMAAQGSAHIACIGALYRACARQIGDSLVVLFQCTIRLTGSSAPDPDLVILPVTYDRNNMPSSSDVLLIAEISDTSLNHDRTRKLPLYAQAGIPESWIFNLVDHRIERFTQPREGAYLQISIATQGESLRSTVLSSLTFDVDEIFRLGAARDGRR